MIPKVQYLDSNIVNQEGIGTIFIEKRKKKKKIKKKVGTTVLIFSPKKKKKREGRYDSIDLIDL